jgi:phage baseplate assembly protein W
MMAAMHPEYLGKGWNFPPEFRLNGAEVVMVGGEDDIVQSLRIILSTQLKERTMFPEFGSGLQYFMFAEKDESMVTDVRNVISTAILDHEPRIEMDSLEVEEDPDELGLLLLSIRYTVRATNNRYNMVFPYYLQEANNPIT